MMISGAGFFSREGRALLPRLAFSGLLVLLFVFLTWEAVDFPARARYMPLTFGILGGVLSLVDMVTTTVRARRVGRSEARLHRESASRKRDTPREAPPELESKASALPYVAWVLAYLVFLWVGGAYGGSIIWLASFLRIENKSRWQFVLAACTAAGVLIWAMQMFLGLRWPNSLLF